MGKTTTKEETIRNMGHSTCIRQILCRCRSIQRLSRRTGIRTTTTPPSAIILCQQFREGQIVTDKGILYCRGNVPCLSNSNIFPPPIFPTSIRIWNAYEIGVDGCYLPQIAVTVKRWSTSQANGRCSQSDGC